MATASQGQYGPAYDILIVDNKELTRDTVQKILQQEGYTVDTARHGKDAIEKMRANSYAYRLVITELIMPFAGGFEVIKTVKKESRVPVMVLSAVADEDTINESFRLGAEDFLKKPFMASELVQRIQRLLIRYAAPVYPKVAPAPQVTIVPPPSVLINDTVDEADKVVEAVISKRKRSIKAAASGVAPKKTAAKKSTTPKKAAAPKVTASKTSVKKKVDAEATTAVEEKLATTKAKTTRKTTSAAKATTTAAKKTATPTVKKTAATTAKPAAKKTVATKAKKTPAKKTAATPAREGGKSAPAKGKSKVIIRNSIPMIRMIPQGDSRVSLKKTDLKRKLCAIAV